MDLTRKDFIAHALLYSCSHAKLASSLLNIAQPFSVWRQNIHDANDPCMILLEMPLVITLCSFIVTSVRAWGMAVSARQSMHLLFILFSFSFLCHDCVYGFQSWVLEQNIILVLVLDA